MSNKLERRLRLLTLVCLMKYFCACDATCVGVLVVTKCREIPRQSPFPSFCNPIKKFLCSSSVHATPRHRERVRRQSRSEVSRIKYLRRAIRGGATLARFPRMRPEYAKYRDFTKKIQKAKSTRRADAVARRRIPASRARARRARVARASRERRDIIPSRAFASHRARAPLLPLLSRVRR